MKLRGVPADMWTGPVDVRHTFKTRLLFVPCGFCKFFHVEYFMCDMGHTTCRDCGTEELKKVHRDRATAPCWGCGTRVFMRRTVLTADALQSEVVICPCGYQAGLRQIHEHLRESKYMYGCVLGDKSLELMELDHFKKSIFDLTTIKHKIEYAEDNLVTFFSMGLVKPLPPGETKVDEISKIERYIGIVEKRIDKIKEILRDVHSMNQELLPTLEAAFRSDCWLMIDFERVAERPENFVKTVISGIPLGFLTRHGIIDGKPWLGVHIYGCVFDSKSQQRKNCYPLRVKVTIRLHNTLGYIPAKVCMKTYQNGVFACKSFEEPAAEYKNSVGNPSFISMEELYDNHLQFQGKLCFSFQIEPLFEKADVL